jgi:hypothetical protein
LEFEHDFVAVRNGGPELFYRGSEAARELGIRIETVDHVIPHQANGRMAELLGPFLGIEPSHVFVNADLVGNTGSAAMWLALDPLRPKLEPGAKVLALGAEATKYTCRSSRGRTRVFRSSSHSRLCLLGARGESTSGRSGCCVFLSSVHAALGISFPISGNAWMG